ncbi:MAG: hypothetical protein ACYCZK_00410 [Microbacteriaceae bacterium]
MMATRLRPPGGRKPAWIDLRLIVGTCLVGASVLGVMTIVLTADKTIEIYAAGEALSPGEQVTVEDLVVHRVRLGPLDARYLSSGDLPQGGVVIIRAVAKGELVPVSAVGDPTGLRVAPVVLPVRGQLARSVVPGSPVDVWAAQKLPGGGFGPPIVLAGSATVVRISAAGGIAAGASAGSIEVLIPRSALARVLEAVANGEAISLVPGSIPVRD